MTKVHRALLASLEPVRAVLLDTPFAFQTNVPQMTDKILEYFDTSLQLAMVPLHYGGSQTASAVEQALYRRAIEDANYVFAGPGSPSYAVAHWHDAAIKDALETLVNKGGTLCFASAAALTLGSHTAPIYEIYKAGAPLSWLEGLDVLALAGLDCAVIPHYDNAEGANYDTRRCYLGEDRLNELESQLPLGTGILGVDEHTAALIDLELDTLTVSGRANAYWRINGVTETISNGSTVALATLRSEHRVIGHVEAPLTAAGTDPPDLEVLANMAIAGGPAGVEAAAELVRRVLAAPTSQSTPNGLLDGLVALRDDVRARRDFSTADQLRNLLEENGITVRDGPEGSSWLRR